MAKRKSESEIREPCGKEFSCDYYLLYVKLMTILISGGPHDDTLYQIRKLIAEQREKDLQQYKT